MRLNYNTAWTRGPKLFAHGPDLVGAVAQLRGAVSVSWVKFKEKVTSNVDLLEGHHPAAAVVGTVLCEDGRQSDFSLVQNGTLISTSVNRPGPPVKRTGQDTFEVTALGVAELMDALVVSAAHQFYDGDAGNHGRASGNNHYLIEVSGLEILREPTAWVRVRQMRQREVRGLRLGRFEFQFSNCKNSGSMVCAMSRSNVLLGT